MVLMEADTGRSSQSVLPEPRGPRNVSLIYHDIVATGAEGASGFPGPAAERYKISAGLFAEHLRALRSVVERRTAITPCTSDMMESLPPHVTALLLHFDDGGRSALHAADLLEMHGFRGHFHIVTSMLGRPGFLAVGSLRDLVARGHEIGTHSVTHPARIDRLAWPDLVAEWRDSRDSLCDVVGRSVTIGAVPGGWFTRRVAEAANAAGLRTLFTSEPVTKPKLMESCMVLGRFAVVHNTPATRAASLLEGSRSSQSRAWLAWNAKKLAKSLPGPLWQHLRALAIRLTSTGKK